MKTSVFSIRFLAVAFVLVCTGLGVSHLASADWPGDTSINVPISTAPSYQVFSYYTTNIASDGAGGAIITWEDYRNGNYDVYAQRVDAFGAIQWTLDGVPISTAANDQSDPSIVSDGFGGAIITWTDLRSGEWNIYAQRVDTSGITLWETNGVQVCSTEASHGEYPRVVSDGAGGAIVAWTDYRDGGFPYGGDVYAQRVDASGTVLWETDGVPTCTDLDDQTWPIMVSDGSGGAIIAWVDHRNAYTDIYAQRVDSSGAILWETDGIPISAAPNTQVHPTISDDGSDGAIITWVDNRNSGATLEYDIYAQRVDASGTLLWPGDVPVCTAEDIQTWPQITSDGAGGAIITWEDRRDLASNNEDVYAQRVDASGAIRWALDGVPISTVAGNQTYPVIVDDGAGGALIAWADGRHGDYDIFAQRVDASGIVQWASDGEPVCTATGGQSYPKIVGDDGGGAIVAWYDWRNGNVDIYAQHTIAPNSPPTVDAHGPYSVDEGGEIIVTASGSDPDGDPLSFAWDLDNDDIFETPGQSATFSAAEIDGPDSHVIQVQATDTGGLSAVEQTTVDILNVAPMVTLAGADTANEESTVHYSHMVSDPGADTFILNSASCGAGGTLSNLAFDDNTGAGSFDCTFPNGPETTTVSVVISDDDGGSDGDSLAVTIYNVAPAPDAGSDQTVFRHDSVNVAGTWTDPAGSADEPYTWSWDLDGDGTADSSGVSAYGATINRSASFPLEGFYTLTFAVTDRDGAGGSDSLVVTVLNQAPVCSAASPSINTLWPPNHTLVAVDILGMTDPEGDTLTITIDGIFQDEPVDSIGDGSFTPDGLGVGTSTAQVRAERDGSGNGRVYHLYFTADDGHGGTCTGEVLVSVPKSQGKNGTAVDDGPLYDSTEE